GDPIRRNGVYLRADHSAAAEDRALERQGAQTPQRFTDGLVRGVARVQAVGGIPKHHLYVGAARLCADAFT
ncbi:hypothetical protein, partial [Puniceibacterium confluentis]|uniref:hypothetical protein n=1 Tax=Puniceibacterium confluentis TaxID=1958944 RepID=UPI00356579D6